MTAETVGKRPGPPPIDYPLSDNPDWDAIRDAFQHGCDSVVTIARRHGVAYQAISNRVRSHHWYRLSERGMATATMNDAIIDMAMDVKTALRSLMKRARTLLARAEKDPGETDPTKLMAAHQVHLESFGRLLQMIERLEVLFERASKGAANNQSIPEQILNADREIESRLAKIAAAVDAGEDL